MNWESSDPRESVSKHSFIAICVDGMIFGGKVETDHGYSVFLHPNHLERRIINPDDNWPEGWRWVFVPSTSWR